MGIETADGVPIVIGQNYYDITGAQVKALDITPENQVIHSETKWPYSPSISFPHFLYAHIKEPRISIGARLEIYIGKQLVHVMPFEGFIDTSIVRVCVQTGAIQ